MAKVKMISMVISLSDDGSKTIYIRPHVIFPIDCGSNCGIFSWIDTGKDLMDSSQC